MNKIYILLFAFVAVSCKPNPTRQQPVSVSTSLQIIELPEPAELKIENITDSITCIPLETNNECLLSNIYKIEVYDNTFYIIDDKGEAIFIFDSNGKFRSKISHQGRGAEEYFKITDISFDPLSQKLIASDCFSRKIFTYTPDGNLEKIIQMDFDPNYITGLGANTFVHLHSHRKEKLTLPLLKNYDLQLLDSTGKITTGAIKNQTPLSINISTPRCASRTISGDILYAPILTDTIYRITGSGEVYPEYIFQNMTSASKTIKPDFRAKICYNEQNRTLLQLSEQGYLFYNGTLFNSPDFLIAEFGLNEKRKRLIYSKRGQKSILYDLENIKGEKMLGRITKYIMVQQNDTYYSAYAPAMLKLITEIEHIPENEIKKYVPDLDENNNPLIFSFKFKEF